MKTILTILLLFSGFFSFSQKTENLILITLDGLRWQELYAGADSLLIHDSGYVENPEELVHEFWDNDPLVRRKTLMPFFWSKIAIKGQLCGNRKFGNKVNCTNQMWFSYPGYNEILCGFADDERISSNSKINNPNTTFLEYLNNTKRFKGKVAAFGSWNVFPYIINEERSGIYVNAGFKKAKGSLSDREQFLNKIQDEIRGPWGGVRLDVFTHHYALEELKKNKPKVLYISYGETDDYAHDGEYDQYLWSARQTDAYIKELWDFVQSTDQYRDKTTIIITTDHGRGTVPKDTWRHHGIKIEGAGEIWMAVLGPDTKPLGEVKTEGQLYQNQIAATAIELLGEKYEEPRAGKSIAAMKE
ncbi:MAG: alkaline phosphatase family protein [Cyclobacteriaceae bacterium]